MNARRAVYAAATSLLAIACTSGDGPNSSAVVQTPASCTSTAGCPIDRICKQPDGVCAPLPVDEFVGTFSCVVLPSGAKRDESQIGTADVEGSVNHQALRFTNSTACSQAATSDGTKYLLLHVFALPSSDGFDGAVSAIVKWTDTQGQADIPLNAARSSAVPDPVGTVDQTANGSDSILAYGTGGTLHLDAPPALNATLTGRIDLPVRGAAASNQAGIACPNGPADCGSNPLLICEPVGSPMAHHTCTASCQSNADCLPLAGICVGGICSRQCKSDSDCDPSLRCVAIGSATDPNVCF